MAVTIHTVAEAAGVSVTTVSFVLNNSRPHVDAIPKETRERVKAAAKALGYRRNITAASLRTGKSHWIGAIMHTFKDETDAWIWAPYEISLLSGIQKTAFDNGFFTVLGSNHPFNERDAIDALVSSGIGGIILNGPSEEAVQRVQELVADGMKAVAIFPLKKEDLYPYSIDIDNYKAGALAADIFNKINRKRIAYVWDATPEISHNERVKGFCDEVTKNNGYMPGSENLIGSSDTDPLKLEKAIKFLHRERPDAVLAVDGTNTCFLSLAAERLNICVPEDLAIIGFDCYSFVNARGQRLSAIGTSWWEAGQLAARSIIDIITEKAEWTEPKTIDLRFIPGHSTPPELAQGSDVFGQILENPFKYNRSINIDECNLDS